MCMKIDTVNKNDGSASHCPPADLLDIQTDNAPITRWPDEPMAKWPDSLLPFVPEALAQVLVAAIGEDRHHHAAGQSIGNLEGSHHGGAGRDSYQEPFLARNAQGHDVSVFSGTFQVFVGHAGVVNTRLDGGRHRSEEHT